MRSTVYGGIRGPVLAVVIFLGGPTSPTTAHAASGPFDRQQAEAGHVIYNDHCAECHGPELAGALGASLVDAAFKAKWSGRPVSDLRDWIFSNMPPNAPGTLPDAQLDPIVAWILMKNGVAPGATPLSRANAGDVFPKE
ncbi:c-type cytochrome [Methylorubrum salsuginis]|uniref:Cytochrome C oxidase, cbb3-type, subunit III n=1 Tax=Methylorubrum salsuginis TaxID=414703 RepID=A0A1I4D4K4_9HYPH|nr:cytochrome c [Methylorubrum salsuginis]SFK87923.1 Cytochrome C oxidase, cbb3-type, subunit III [Methylorubrum salsuginis]